MTYRPRFDWLRLSPDARRIDSNQDDRALSVNIMVETLRTDPDWASLRGDTDRRQTARRLLAVRWAVRNGRLSDGQ